MDGFSFICHRVNAVRIKMKYEGLALLKKDSSGPGSSHINSSIFGMTSVF